MITLLLFRLKQALEIPADDPIENLSWYNEEMEEATDGYVSYVLERSRPQKRPALIRLFWSNSVWTTPAG